MIRAVIFDCFGVLLVDAFEALVAPLRDSDPALAKALDDIARACNKGLLTADEFAQQCASLLHMNVQDFRSRISEGEHKNVAVMEFAGSLRPAYKTAVLSNASMGGLRRRFAEGELEKYFDAIVVSADIGFAKPEAQAYEIAAERLGVRLQECVMIDDRQEYCDGAVAVGMQAVRFQTLEQLQRDLASVLSADAED